MKLTRVHPSPAESVELDDAASRARLLEWYAPERPDWIRVNLVSSVNGSAVGPDGTSESLTSPTDRRILGVIRELADVVLIGAASVRAEGYQVPRKAGLAILTTSGDLQGHRLAPEHAGRVMVIVPSSGARAASESLPGAQIIVTPASDDGIAPADAVAALRAAGCSNIVCEGGPSLAGRVIEAGLVDDVCLTTSPVLRETTTALLGAAPLSDHPLELRHVLVDAGGFLFTRWSAGGSRSTR